MSSQRSNVRSEADRARGSLLYNQNGAEYILGVFTDGTCSTVVTTYDINPGAIASVDDGVQQLDPSNTYYGFCAVSHRCIVTRVS